MREEDLRNRIGSGGITQTIEQYLRAEIIKGHLQPGSHLVEGRLAEQLGVSKTPIREAIMSLARSGLVEMIPYKGSFVKEITPRFIEEVMSIRILLETFAVRRALPILSDEDFALMRQYAEEMDEMAQKGDFYQALERDVKFHNVIFKKADHSLLWEVWQYVQAQVNMLQTYARLYAAPLKKGYVLENHLRLLRVLETRNLDECLKAIEEHVDISQQVITAYEKRQQKYEGLS